MFREPEDAKVEVCGWPWHGLIVDGVLTLPSGRTMALVNGQRGNETSLWDIGLPNPTYVPADPDEQWLGKAIIRGSRYFYLGGNAQWPAIEQQYQNPPVYVGGQLYKARDLEAFTFDLPGGGWGVRVDIFINGVRYQSNVLSSADISLPPQFAPNGRGAASIIDHRWDRGRWLLQVSIPDGARALPVAILEARLQVGPMAMTLVKLAGADQVLALQLAEDTPLNQPVSAFLSGSGARPLVAGTYNATRTARFLSSAFYKNNADVALVYTNVEAISTLVAQGDNNVWRDENINTARIWLDGDLGTTSVIEASFTEVADRPVISQPGTRTARYFIGADQVHERSEVLPTTASRRGYLPDTDYSAWVVDTRLPLYFESVFTATGRSPTPGGGLTALGGSRASNNIFQPSVSVSWVDGPRITVRSVGSAITPSGIDPGGASFDSRNHTTDSQAASKFGSGSYNPITGQVVRNQTDHFYSWV